MNRNANFHNFSIISVQQKDRWSDRIARTRSIRRVVNYVKRKVAIMRIERNCQSTTNHCAPVIVFKWDQFSKIRVKNCHCSTSIQRHFLYDPWRLIENLNMYNMYLHILHMHWYISRTKLYLKLNLFIIYWIYNILNMLLKVLKIFKVLLKSS